MTVDQWFWVTVALVSLLVLVLMKRSDVLSRRAERGTPSPVRGGRPHARGTAVGGIQARRRPDLYDWEANR